MFWTLFPLCVVFSDSYAVFATRTEIKVWQDYHLRKLLNKYRLQEAVNNLLVAILRTRYGHNKCQFTARKYPIETSTKINSFRG